MEDRVKEVSSSSSDSGSEDELQDSPQQEQQGGDGSPNRSRISRNEKKARKAVLRHGMKQIPDIVKVVLRKAKQVGRCAQHDSLSLLCASRRKVESGVRRVLAGDLRRRGSSCVCSGSCLSSPTFTKASSRTPTSFSARPRSMTPPLWRKVSRLVALAEPSCSALQTA